MQADELVVTIQVLAWTLGIGLILYLGPLGLVAGARFVRERLEHAVAFLKHRRQRRWLSALLSRRGFTTRPIGLRTTISEGFVGNLRAEVLLHHEPAAAGRLTITVEGTV